MQAGFGELTRTGEWFILIEEEKKSVKGNGFGGFCVDFEEERRRINEKKKKKEGGYVCRE